MAKWQKKHVAMLEKIAVNDKPREIIHTLSEAILKSFSDKKLIDKYDVYQHLMTYWMETMKDDVYIFVEDGWVAEPYLIKDKNGKVKKGQWDCDLVPKSLVINRYFSDDQAVIEQMETERDDISRQKEEMEEEHSGEEGLLEEVRNDKGNISKGSVQKRIKDIKNDPDSADELKVLQEYLGLIEDEASANKKVKDALLKLDKKVFKKYKELTEDEIKKLVVDDKWMTAIERDVKSEMDRISQRLTQRIKELAERYEMPLPKLTAKVEEIASNVDAHLEKMGFAW